MPADLWIVLKKTECRRMGFGPFDSYEIACAFRTRAEEENGTQDGAKFLVIRVVAGAGVAPA
jgi:hypothetical protein